MSTIEIWLLCIFAYPILWVIFSSVMSFVTIIDFKILRPMTLKNDKLGLKGSIEFWWLIPGLAVVYPLLFIFQTPINAHRQKRNERKKIMFYHELAKKIRGMEVGEQHTFERGGLNFYFVRNKEHYSVSLYVGSNRRIEAFVLTKYVIAFINCCHELEDEKIDFKKFNSNVDFLMHLDHFESTMDKETETMEDVKLKAFKKWSSDIVQNEITEKLKRSLP